MRRASTTLLCPLKGGQLEVEALSK